MGGNYRLFLLLPVENSPFAILPEMQQYGGTMSVLFEALNKAARDYRRQQSPIIFSIVPTTAGINPNKRARLVIAMASIAVLFVLSAVVSESFTQKTDVLATNQIIAAAQTPVSNRSGEGIILTADTQSPDVSNEKELDILAQQLSDVPAIDQANASVQLEDRGPVGHVTVTTVPQRSSVTSLLHQADRAMRTQQWDEAYAYYDKVLAEEPMRIEALTGKLFVLEQRGKVPDLQEIDRMILGRPRTAQLYVARARVLAKMGKPDLALEAWDRALSLEPANKEYQLGLAILHDALGHEDEALRQYRLVAPPLPLQAQRRLEYLASRQRKDAVIPVSE